MSVVRKGPRGPKAGELAYSSTATVIQRAQRTRQQLKGPDMGHLNVFQFCTGLKIIGSFMILVVLSIVVLSYHAIVISSYGPDLAAGGWRTAVAALVLVLFHGLVSAFRYPGVAPPRACPQAPSSLAGTLHNSGFPWHLC